MNRHLEEAAADQRGPKDDFTWRENPLPGDMITFAKKVKNEFGEALEDIREHWHPFATDIHVEQVTEIHRVSWGDENRFAGKEAMVIQRLPNELVHRYNRLVDKYTDWDAVVEGKEVAPTTEERWHPFPEIEWLYVLCDGNLLYAGRWNDELTCKTAEEHEHDERLGRLSEQDLQPPLTP